MKIFPVAFVSLLVTLTVACRTTTPSSDSTSAASGGTAGAKVDGFNATLTLAKGEEQDLYLKMLQIELAAGIKVAKDQLHSTQGLASCKRDAALESCSVQVRLMNDELSSSQPVSKPLEAKLWRFVRDARPDLAAESLVFVGLNCDYIGKKSPPYTVEDVSCKASHPRAPNEAVFVGRVAEEIADMMRGEAPYGEKPAAMNGTLVCQWVGAAKRAACMVRAIEQGVLQEKIREVTTQVAPQVGRSLQQALADHLQQKAAADKQTAEAFTPPSEIGSALTCLVDNARYEADGSRRAVCRAKL